MSTQTLAIPHTQAFSQKRSFRNLWRRPRIVAVNASELIESRTAPACDPNWAGIDANNTAYRRRYLALAARWKDRVIAGAVLEIRDRTAILRLFQVDEAWRQRGVGRRLLRGLLRRASFQFIGEVHVLAKAVDAGFYALHGFRPVDAKENTPDPLNGFDGAGLREKAPDDGDHLIMHRHLTSPFVSVPYDGIMVKMG